MLFWILLQRNCRFVTPYPIRAVGGHAPQSECAKGIRSHPFHNGPSMLSEYGFPNRRSSVLLQLQSRYFSSAVQAIQLTRICDNTLALRCSVYQRSMSTPSRVAFKPRLFQSKKSHESEGNTKKAPKQFKKKQPANHYRADRVLSNRGWGSRSECHKLLKERRVYVQLPSSNGTIDDKNTTSHGHPNQEATLQFHRIDGPSEKIPMDASLWIDRKHEVPLPPPLLRVYHKPKWVLSVMGDEKYGRKNLLDLDFLSREVSLNKKHSLHPVGRLDYDSSGLLLFSSDGPLTQTLLHPNHEIEKEYLALVVGHVPDVEELKKKLSEGIETKMGIFPAQVLQVTVIPEEEVSSRIGSIVDNLPPEYNLEDLRDKGYLFFTSATQLSEIRLTVKEGKYRMVRRILANVGYPVIGLKRERLGSIQLNDLKEGEYRDITEEEEKWAKSLLKRKN